LRINEVYAERTEKERPETEHLRVKDLSDALTPEQLARVLAAAYLSGGGGEAVTEAGHLAELLSDAGGAGGLTVEDVARRFGAKPVDESPGDLP
jgi:hypothetical protein